MGHTGNYEIREEKDNKTDGLTRIWSQKENSMYSRILTPLDGSTTAKQALPYARSLAKTLKISV